MGVDPNQLWAHPALQSAANAGDFGALFGLWLRLSGESQTQLGARTGLAQGDVSAIKCRRRRVTSHAVRRRILDGLGYPSTSVDSTAGEVPLGPDPDLPARMAALGDGGRARVDHTAVDWLERLLAEHRRAEDEVGSGVMFGIVRQQLESLTALYAGARGQVADHLVRVAAEHAQFLAWMAQDQGSPSAALAWHDRALEWATEAGDPDMIASTLSMRAHLAWSLGAGSRCVRLADAAAGTVPGASARVRAMAVQMAARGHALQGEAELTHRLLDDAERLLAAGHPPAWMYFHDQTWLQLQRGVAELHLEAWAPAAALLTDGLEQLPTTYPRDWAWYGSCLARAHAGQRAADAALTVAQAALPGAVAVGRPATWDMLRSTGAALLRQGAPQGRAVVDAIARAGH